MSKPHQIIFTSNADDYFMFHLLSQTCPNISCFTYFHELVRIPREPWHDHRTSIISARGVNPNLIMHVADAADCSLHEINGQRTTALALNLDVSRDRSSLTEACIWVCADRPPRRVCHYPWRIAPGLCQGGRINCADDDRGEKRKAGACNNLTHCTEG